MCSLDGAVAEVQADHVDAGAAMSDRTQLPSASMAGPSVATIFVRRLTVGASGSSDGESHLLI